MDAISRFSTPAPLSGWVSGWRERVDPIASADLEFTRRRMRTDQFEAWLRDDYDESVVRTRLSNCKRVEDFEGDLDEHYADDGMAELEIRLTYSTDDERQGRPALHSIPINGNLRTGTAPLKSAVCGLYKRFCEAWPRGTPKPAPLPDGPLSPAPGPKPKRKPRPWPVWPQPDDAEALQLARVAMRYVRFLAPDIVGAIAADNERHREKWRPALASRNIRPDAYLWESSPCAFPGVRRYAGSREVAVYRGHLLGEDAKFEQALRLDDNDCPKHLWSHVLCGTKFQKHGPPGYALAHLADHKSHGNRFESDFELVSGQPECSDLFGLYCCPTNTVYIPTSMIKPTDFGGPMRNLLLRRAHALYGEHCNLTPNWLRIPPAASADWQLDAFEWSEPVGAMEGVASFLDFRNKELERLMAQA